MVTIRSKNAVTETPAAPSAEALAHFQALLRLETDCTDVYQAVSGSEDPGFVLFDVRSSKSFASGHVPGAVSLPHSRIHFSTLEEYDEETLFVVYCAGPHCNGADKAAARLAELGRPVKKMIGGIEGWRDEGYPLEVE